MVVKITLTSLLLTFVVFAVEELREVMMVLKKVKMSFALIQIMEQPITKEEIALIMSHTHGIVLFLKMMISMQRLCVVLAVEENELFVQTQTMV